MEERNTDAHTVYTPVGQAVEVSMNLTKVRPPMDILDDVVAANVAGLSDVHRLAYAAPAPAPDPVPAAS